MESLRSVATSQKELCKLILDFEENPNSFKKRIDEFDAQRQYDLAESLFFQKTIHKAKVDPGFDFLQQKLASALTSMLLNQVRCRSIHGC